MGLAMVLVMVSATPGDFLWLLLLQLLLKRLPLLKKPERNVTLRLIQLFFMEDIMVSLMVLVLMGPIPTTVLELSPHPLLLLWRLLPWLAMPFLIPMCQLSTMYPLSNMFS